jgi:CcmD family protein
VDERNFLYMFYGFAAAWLIVVLYVISLVRREKDLRKQLDQLRHMLEHQEKKP